MPTPHRFAKCVLAIIACATPAFAGIIVDQPPSQYAGSASDTAFYNEYGLLRWQQLADDFTLDADASIRQLTWWGFYSGQSLDPPLGDETMRVRFYAERAADGLPGVLLREHTVLNTQRVATGRRVGALGSPFEYRFDLPLSTPFEALGGARYWVEVVQIGIDDSHFRWQYSESTTNGCAFINLNVADWTPLPPNLAMQFSDVPEPTSLWLVALIALIGQWNRKLLRR